MISSEVLHYPCDSNTGDWAENQVAWEISMDGYLRADATSWNSAIVSREMYSSEDTICIIARIHVASTSNYMVGFTSEDFEETDFHYDGLDAGVYVHSTGTVRPTWDVNNFAYWNKTLEEGIFDIRVMIDGGNNLFRADAEQVPGYDAPLSEFIEPDWSVIESRSIGGDYSVQVNPYNPAGQVYDLWIMSDITVTEGLRLDHIGDCIVIAGDTLSIQLEASGNEPEDILTFSTDAGAVLPSVFAFDGDTGLFEWSPAPEDAGSYEVTFSVTDGDTTDSETISITVLGEEVLWYDRCDSNERSWANNDIVWETDLDGYVRADVTSWNAAIVSREMY
ncbi:MAG TPA: Ig domain-containing protein, partial [Candidatus Krumholzibacterium sp.]|nr:Ig domain-containing protein [Candidatus Krumholzibacterium sp.]